MEKSETNHRFGKNPDELDKSCFALMINGSRRPLIVTELVAPYELMRSCDSKPLGITVVSTPGVVSFSSYWACPSRYIHT